MARRSISLYANYEKCTMDSVNIHVGKHCLFLVPTEHQGCKHTNHPDLEKINLKEHVSQSVRQEIETVAAAKACPYNIAKAVTQLHDGNIVITKGQAQYHVNNICYKANVSDHAVPKSELNDPIGVAKILQGY